MYHTRPIEYESTSEQMYSSTVRLTLYLGIKFGERGEDARGSGVRHDAVANSDRAISITPCMFEKTPLFLNNDGHLEESQGSWLFSHVGANELMHC